MAIPEQIRRQSEAIAKLYEDVNADAEAKVEAAGETQEQTSQADSAEKVAPESKRNEQTRSDTGSEDTAEQRYRTLQGMYNADTARLRMENQQLNNRLTQLEQLLSTMASQPAQQQQTLDRLVTDKDVEEYGDSIDVMRRVTKEETAMYQNRIAELEHMIRQVQTSVVPKVEQVAHRQAVSAEQNFWYDLSAAFPQWKEVNADRNFQNWLLEIDPLTGISRQTYLEDAQRNMDVRRVASFFYTWQDINGQPVAQSPRNAAASELDKQVSPGRSRGGSAPAEQQAKTYSAKDIAKFFDDVRKGVYHGKEAERDRIERDIFSAQKENRIVANG
jgi:hypothetical protein